MLINSTRRSDHATNPSEIIKRYSFPIRKNEYYDGYITRIELTADQQTKDTYARIVKGGIGSSEVIVEIVARGTRYLNTIFTLYGKRRWSG